MTTTHKGVQLFYTDTGKGETVVLLHGFLENSTMWNFLIPHIEARYRILCIDLLGHGNSECTGYIHTMDAMATAVCAVIDHLQIDIVTIIGHSMGGYVGCAFAKAYPEKLKALCLLNSSPLPDSSERKLLRTRANKMAKTQYTQLIRMSFLNLFDDKTKKTFKKEIIFALNEALKTKVQGYIAANSGMMFREDYSKIWINGSFIKAMILGEEDWIVNSEIHKNLFMDYCDYFKILRNGHMSHIGQKKSLFVSLEQFLTQEK